MTLEFNDILLYADANGKVKIDVIYEEETFWLSQKKMAELFDVGVSADKNRLVRFNDNFYIHQEIIDYDYTR